MKRYRWCPGLWMAVLVLAGASATAQTTRVSVGSGGTEGNRASFYPAVSGDGRFVAFTSAADNLVPGDTNFNWDVFLHNRETRQTLRISMPSDGSDLGEPQGDSFRPSVSRNGLFVAFDSDAPNLVRQDRSNGSDVFVRNLMLGDTTRVSVSSSGSDANFQSNSASISGDGHFVAFLSLASNLVPVDTNARWDVFVRDMQRGLTTRVSVASDGSQAKEDSFNPSISDDGRIVAFTSNASNLVSRDTNGIRDVFVHDRETGLTTRISGAADTSQANGLSSSPSVSADGRFITFMSWATNLVPGDTNGEPDIFVHDRVMARTTRVSVADGGAQANGYSDYPSVSADGRFIGFHSSASNLVAGDTNGEWDIFEHDRLASQTVRVSVASDGTQSRGNLSAYMPPAISADGRVIAFQSYALNLVSDDVNGVSDVFARVLDVGAPPGAPSNLTAQVAGSSVRFTWSAPATGGPRLTYVFRGGASAAASTFEFASGGTATSHEATSVPRGTYYVRVHAANAFGTGPPSNEVIVQIGPSGCAEPPGRPSGLVASVSGRVVTLAWAASAGCPATSYDVEAGSAPAASDIFAGDVGGATSLSAPAPLSTYYVRVRGRNAFGVSGPSNEVTVTVP